MTFTIDKVVPWGRSYIEYTSMFALSERGLKRRILDCGGGPSSFNSLLTEQGGQVITCDPIYGSNSGEIERWIEETYDQVVAETKRNRHEFVWNSITSVKELGRIRRSAMKDFLADYVEGKEQGRYVEASLPELPFKDHEFDLALCSHLLFLYSEQLSYEFHLRSIKELCRVSAEVRIFPLQELGAVKSRYLDRIVRDLVDDGYEPVIVGVPYEFQKGRQ